MTAWRTARSSVQDSGTTQHRAAVRGVTKAIKIPSPEAVGGQCYIGGRFDLVNGGLKMVPSRATYPRRAGLQRLRGIDVEEGALALDRHFGHRLGMTGDQMARADVAVERHQFVEEAPRPHHRIAAPAVDDRHHDQRAALGIERRDQPVDQVGRSTCGMSPRQTIAPSASCGTAAMPALTELARALRRNPDCARSVTFRPGKRVLDLLAPDGR